MSTPVSPDMPADAAPIAPVALIALRCQSVDEFLEQANQSGLLSDGATALVKQTISDSVRAARELARAARTVVLTPDGTAKVYEFAPNPAVASQLRSQLSGSLSAHLPGGSTEALLTALAEAAGSDPSLDLMNHHRQIAVLPGEEENRWQVWDRTFTAEGNLLASNTVFLGLDEDGQLVWPEEYVVLLGE